MAESCGKCVPCRAGTAQMYDCCARSAKRGHARRPGLAESLCDMVKHTSLCGLGQAAPNPRDQHLALFRDEAPCPYSGETLPSRRMPNEA